MFTIPKTKIKKKSNNECIVITYWDKQASPLFSINIATASSLFRTPEPLFQLKQLVFENTENNENEGIRHEIWDNPGEMFFSVMAHLFRRTHAFLIVIDITDDEDLNKARFWIEEMWSKGLLLFFFLNCFLVM